MSTIGVGAKRGKQTRPPSSHNDNNTNNNTVVVIPDSKRTRVNSNSIGDATGRVILNFILHMVDAVKDGVLFHVPVKNKAQFYTLINTLFSSTFLEAHIGARLNKATILETYYKPAGGSSCMIHILSLLNLK